MNRLIPAALGVVLLVALLLWRRSSRKPGVPDETVPLPEPEAAPPAVESIAPAVEEAAESPVEVA